MADLLEWHRITSVLALSFCSARPRNRPRPGSTHLSVIDADVPHQRVPRAGRRGTIARWMLVVVLTGAAAAGAMRWSTWRALLHFLSFPCYMLALLHGLTTGTDAGNMLALLLYAITAAIVAAMISRAFLQRLGPRGTVDSIAQPQQLYADAGAVSRAPRSR